MDSTAQASKKPQIAAGGGGGDNTASTAPPTNPAPAATATATAKKSKAAAVVMNVAKGNPFLYYSFVTIVMVHIFTFFYIRIFELMSMCSRSPLHFFIFLAIIVSLASLYAKPPATLGFFARRLVLLLIVFSQLGKEMDITFNSSKLLPGSLERQVAIVTGANGKVGSIIASKLASLGSTVVMACRDLDKCNAAKDAIYLEAQRSNSNTTLSPDALITMELNLSDLKSVYDFTNNFKSKFSRLDCLIHNAGFVRAKSVWGESGKTDQGYEESMGAMHLGSMALTNWLYDQLTFQPAESELLSVDNGSRVVYVGSNSYFSGSFNAHLSSFDPESESSVFKDANLGATTFGTDLALARAKLANVLIAFETQKKFDKAAIDKKRDTPRRKVIVSVANPGTLDIESGIKNYISSALLYPYLRRKDAALNAIMYAVHSNDFVPGSYIDAMTYSHDILGFQEKYGATHLAAFNKFGSDQKEDEAVVVAPRLNDIQYFSVDLWYWKNNEDMSEETSQKLWTGSAAIIKKWKAFYDEKKGTTNTN